MRSLTRELDTLHAERCFAREHLEQVLRVLPEDGIADRAIKSQYAQLEVALSSLKTMSSSLYSAINSSQASTNNN